MSSALSAGGQPQAPGRGGSAKHAHSVSRSTVTPLSPGWTDIAATEDLDEAGSKAVGKVPGTAVLLVRTSLGISAVADRCPHCGASLHNGAIDGDCVVCPRHRGVFDLLDGAVLAGPSTQSLALFEVRKVAGRIQVRRSRD